MFSLPNTAMKFYVQNFAAPIWFVLCFLILTNGVALHAQLATPEPAPKTLESETEKLPPALTEYMGAQYRSRDDFSSRAVAAARKPPAR